MAGHERLSAGYSYSARPPVIPRWFWLYLKASGFSAKTIEGYQTALGDFVSFLRASGLDPDPLQAGVDEVRAWIIHLQERSSRLLSHRAHRPLSPHTITAYVRCLRAFYARAVLEGRIPPRRNPFRPGGVQVPTPPRTRPRIYEREHIERMLALCPPNTWWGARDRALILTFLFTGLRLSEVAGIRLPDLDLDAGTVRVLGKGRKERVVALPAPALRAILNWLKYRPEVDHDALWTDQYSRPLTPHAISQMVRKLARRVGVAVPRAVHALRHTFAVHALLEGHLPLRLLQEVLGHTSSRATEIYLQAVDDLMASQVHRQIPIYQGWNIDFPRGRRSERPPV